MHLDSEHRAPSGGWRPISAPFLQPSGHALWDQGPHSGCLPLALPHPSSPCLSTHPSICLSAADLCPRCAGWAGQGPGSRPPGRSVAGALALASSAQSKLCSLVQGASHRPRSCSALVFVPPFSEWGWPAGKATGLMRGGVAKEEAWPGL